MGAPDNDFVSGRLLLEGRSVCLAVCLAVSLSVWLWAGCLLEPCSSAGRMVPWLCRALCSCGLPQVLPRGVSLPRPPRLAPECVSHVYLELVFGQLLFLALYAYFLTESRRPSTFQRRKLSHRGLPQSLRGRTARGAAGLALDPGLGARSR